MEKDAMTEETLKTALRSRLNDLIETSDRIPTVYGAGVADLRKRCVVLLLEAEFDPSILEDRKVTKEWTDMMKMAIDKISAAEKRARFWTTESRWRTFFKPGRSLVRDIGYATERVNCAAGELILFKQMHRPDRGQAGVSPPPSRHPSGSRPTSVDSVIPVLHDVDRVRIRGRLLRQSTIQGRRSRRSIVSEGHTSPDEDGESRKRVGPPSVRSYSVGSSLGA